ncbi:MAG: nitrate- and nitrite sensing domain-containing protein, partial [Rhodocyclaceae bacterium]
GELVVALGEVAHELQKERGMSAGFLASKGAKFADRLPSQREAGDAKVKALKQSIAAVDPSKVGPRFQKLLESTDGLLGSLTEAREKISAQRMLPPESFRFYSDLITNLFEIAARTGNQMPTAKISRLVNAKGALLYLKERNGQERALLNGAFSAGQISAQEFNTWLTLLGDQSNYQRITVSFASPDQEAFLKAKLEDPVVAEILQIEKMVRDSGPNSAVSYSPETWFTKITAKIDLLRVVEERFSADIREAISAEESAALTALSVYLGLVAVSMMLTIGLGMVIVGGIVRQMGGEPAFAAKIAESIAAGRLDNDIPLGKGDSRSLLASMKEMQRQLRERIEAERKVAADSLRIQSALDKASTNMMVADNDGQIIYMNAAVSQMMRVAESDMRKDLPNFRAEKLLGNNFDAFHKNPAHQRNMLGRLTSVHRTEIKVGGRTFRLVANPVINDQGERLGSVVEWADRTGEVKAEQELAQLLGAAVRGDFAHRLDPEGKEGFFLQMTEGMNKFVDIVSSGLGDIARVLNSVAQGDLTQQITAEYAGTFGQLKEDTNATVSRL